MFPRIAATSRSRLFVSYSTEPLGEKLLRKSDFIAVPEEFKVCAAKPPCILLTLILASELHLVYGTNGPVCHRSYKAQQRFPLKGHPQKGPRFYKNKSNRMAEVHGELQVGSGIQRLPGELADLESRQVLRAVVPFGKFGLLGWFS